MENRVETKNINNFEKLLTLNNIPIDIGISKSEMTFDCNIMNIWIPVVSTR